MSIRHPHKHLYPKDAAIDEDVIRAAWEADPELKQLEVKLLAVRQKINARCEAQNGIIARARGKIRHYRRNDPQMRRTVDHIRRRREQVYNQLWAYLKAKAHADNRAIFGEWPALARFDKTTTTTQQSMTHHETKEDR